jgi:hypothetical protein
VAFTTRRTPPGEAETSKVQADRYREHTGGDVAGRGIESADDPRDEDVRQEQMIAAPMTMRQSPIAFDRSIVASMRLAGSAKQPFIHQ